MTIKPKRYTFTVLTTKKGYDREDLIQLGKDGVIPFYVMPGLLYGYWMDEDDFFEESVGLSDPTRFENHLIENIPWRLTTYQIVEMFRGKELSYFLRDKDIAEGLDETASDYRPLARFFFAPRSFTEDDLVIMTADLEILEQEPATEQPAPTVENDPIIWGWNNMEGCYKGLTRTKIEYGARQLKITFQEKGDDPEDKGRTGLLLSELKMIFLRKRSNAAN